MQLLRFFIVSVVLCGVWHAAELGFGAQAWAHKLSVFSYVEGSAIHTESKFGSGRPCQACETLVADAASGSKLAAGVTDVNGRFSCALAFRPTADVKVTISAGGGHQGEWTLAAAEFSQFDAKAPAAAAPAPATAAPAPVAAAATPAPVTANAPVAASSQPCAVDEALLRKLVAEELEKKVAPLRAMLLDSKLGGPSMVEIAGGIGYILGLAGLAVLLKRRRS